MRSWRFTGYSKSSLDLNPYETPDVVYDEIVFRAIGERVQHTKPGL
jgi:hypothetical protein